MSHDIGMPHQYNINAAVSNKYTQYFKRICVFLYK